jgi:hypothetical protein
MKLGTPIVKVKAATLTVVINSTNVMPRIPFKVFMSFSLAPSPCRVSLLRHPLAAKKERFVICL